MSRAARPPRAGATRRVRVVAAALALLALGGCATIYEYLPVPPSFSLRWLWGDSRKPGPLPELTPSAAASINWQAAVGKAVPGFAPLVLSDAVYAASTDGGISRIDPATGRTVWRASATRTLSAGPGADGNVVVVGTDKGDVLAFDASNGNPKWTARVSTEIVSPRRPALGSVKRYQSRSSDSMLSAVSNTVPPTLRKSVAVATVSLSSKRSILTP